MTEWYCWVNGKRYGPISDTDLAEWMRQGRVSPNDLVWRDGMADWQKVADCDALRSPQDPGADTDLPPPALPPGEQVAAPTRALRAHRGVAVLVLGILGLFTCLVFGIIAWVMGNNDLREMDSGRMDPSGRGMTQGGKICGIISVVFGVVSTAIFLLIAFAAIAEQGF